MKIIYYYKYFQNKFMKTLFNTYHKIIYNIFLKLIIKMSHNINFFITFVANLSKQLYTFSTNG
jgi:hypothetical protein